MGGAWTSSPAAASTEGRLSAARNSAAAAAKMARFLGLKTPPSCGRTDCRSQAAPGLGYPKSLSASAGIQKGPSPGKFTGMNPKEDKDASNARSGAGVGR
jgi:hypothetical protein